MSPFQVLKITVKVIDFGGDQCSDGEILFHSEGIACDLGRRLECARKGSK